MIAVPVLVDTKSVRRGDQLLVGGQAFTVVDILGQPRGGKRLDLGDGVQLVIQPNTVLYATRTVRPRRR
ncbi:hypothetical protein RM780_05120 [Streptomyces sp. DSM 44917]|uniref:NfeD-like C-terminal domain-containing protein n=1 Tax=Streptomyces boetiae TaxID=3075541 RepID=A0ABU2L4J7_9ACTN|nr:hypothetical protein [Streptomyces sp. DSM 44917]MDT0306341.1 hypothetical protein [Streptomyces sp. DSM 44917]